MDENPYRPPSASLDPSLEGADASAGLASRGARLWGAICDGVIGLVVALPLYWFLGVWQTILDGQPIGIGDTIKLTLIGMALFVLLHGYTLATRGQTLGKVIAKTRIVSVRDDSLLSLPRVYLLRYLPISVLSAIPFVGGLFGLANVLLIFRADRRCIHDHIAGTKVISVPG